MHAKVYSSSVIGIEAYLIDVEVDVSPGLPSFSIVGLPDLAVKESKERVITAIKNSGIGLPAKKITINLAPAGIKKEGTLFDLPIAIGLLRACGKLKGLKNFMMVGELALDGNVRGVRGVLPIALKAKSLGFDGILVPKENVKEAAVTGIRSYPVGHLLEVVNFFNGSDSISAVEVDTSEIFNLDSKYDINFADIKGQFFAKRALEISAAGGHNILMIGPPGAGKTMLAKRLPTIFPPLTFEEAMETTIIYSSAGLLPPGVGLITKRPFRSPHHTISDVALVGGGQIPKPGEISLAHNGVLFLDELTEFHRNVLEALREPLENAKITVSRVATSVSFPAKITLVAASNPCPCGYYGHPKKECVCTAYQIQKYLSKLSGPLLDRIDIHIEVPALKPEEITDESISESSSEIRKRVVKTREIQLERFRGEGIYTNSEMTGKLLKKYCSLSAESKSILNNAIEKLGLSARAYEKILKVAKTIADLEGKEIISSSHIAEAIQYRSFDKFLKW